MRTYIIMHSGEVNQEQILASGLREVCTLWSKITNGYKVKKQNSRKLHQKEKYIVRLVNILKIIMSKWIFLMHNSLEQLHSCKNKIIFVSVKIFFVILKDYLELQSFLSDRPTILQNASPPPSPPIWKIIITIKWIFLFSFTFEMNWKVVQIN